MVTGTGVRTFLAGLAGPAAGAFAALVLLLAWPGLYLKLSDALRWRLGLSAVYQLSFEREQTLAHLRGEAHAGPCAVLLFGDSHLQGLPASALGVAASNYAIAGEPAARLAERVGRYASVGQARHIVLLAGANDLLAGHSPEQTAASVAAVLAKLPASVSLLGLPPLPPAWEGQRQALNAQLAQRCAARPGCRFISLDEVAAAGWVAPDGIHLSSAGYALLARKIRANLPTAQCAPG